MNIDIICVGSIKEKYFNEAIKEYLKRMKSYVNLKIIEIDEYKLVNNPSKSQIESGMQKEADDILSKINERSYVIALCIEGKQMSSENFSEKISELTVQGFNDLTFIIGGSNGLFNSVKEKANLKLSFSKFTFTHQLMRVVLLEQIYRAFKIIRNEPYHK